MRLTRSINVGSSLVLVGWVWDMPVRFGVEAVRAGMSVYFGTLAEIVASMVKAEAWSRRRCLTVCCIAQSSFTSRARRIACASTLTCFPSIYVTGCLHSIPYLPNPSVDG
jgi:hypothetical protein